MEHFGQYAISTNPPEVRRGDRLVRLSPKQFSVLAILVNARGKTIRKETFFKRVWRDSTVEESNLSQTIFLLRRALGRLPDGTSYIETISGRGYRLASGALPAGDRATNGAEPLTWLSGSQAVSAISKTNFQLLLDSIEDYAVYFLDPTGRVLIWNRGGELNKGYKSEEVVGQHYSVFFVPEDSESRVADRELAIAAANGRCIGEGWRMRKNGERYWASFALTAVRNESGKLLGYAKVVRDISDRKRQEDTLLRLEAGLRRERDRLRAVADSSMDAIYICEAIRDRDGEIEDFVFIYVNDNVEHMVKLPQAQLLGAKMCELFPRHRTTRWFEAYKEVVTTGKPLVTVASAQEDDLKIEWARVKVLRVEDGIAITVSDITALKRAEARLAQFTKNS